MQLHEFARIVFIEAFIRSVGLGRLAGLHSGGNGIGPDADPVVQVIQHRRALRGSHQEIMELAQRVRTDCIALVAGHQVGIDVFIEKDVEVVVPEIGHHLFKLARAVNGAQNLRLLQLAHHHTGGIVHGIVNFAVSGRKLRQQPVAVFIGQIAGKSHAVGNRQLHQRCHPLFTRNGQQHLRNVMGNVFRLLRGGVLRGLVGGSFLRRIFG